MTEAQKKSLSVLRERWEVVRVVDIPCGDAWLVWVGNKSNPQYMLINIQPDGSRHS